MLLKNENQIIRVLKSHGDKALVIDCIKRTMPKWVDGDSLSNYDDCGEDEMYERTDYPFGRELTPKEERIAQERFTMIAGVLPYIGNEQKRSQMIDFLAEHQSKQTIRKYLCLYLVYQDIDALAPPPRTEKELNQDEKNMRWALNKFFYTKQKNSLTGNTTMKLKFAEPLLSATLREPTKQETVKWWTGLISLCSVSSMKAAAHGRP